MFKAEFRVHPKKGLPVTHGCFHRGPRPSCLSQEGAPHPDMDVPRLSSGAPPLCCRHARLRGIMPHLESSPLSSSPRQPAVRLSPQQHLGTAWKSRYLWGGLGIFVVTSLPEDSSASSGMRTTGPGGGSRLGQRRRGCEDGGRRQGQHHKEHKGAFGPKSYRQNGKERKDRERWESRGGGSGQGRVWGGGRRAGAVGRGLHAVNGSSGSLEPRSHPAPSRHLLRQQQRVMFL